MIIDWVLSRYQGLLKTYATLNCNYEILTWNILQLMTLVSAVFDLHNVRENHFCIYLETFSFYELCVNKCFHCFRLRKIFNVRHCISYCLKPFYYQYDDKPKLIQMFDQFIVFLFINFNFFYTLSSCEFLSQWTQDKHIIL